MDSELWLSRFEDYARSYRRSESTIQGYLVELRRFLAFLVQRGLKQPHELTAADVEAYQVSLEHWRKPNGEMLTVQSKNYRMSSVRTSGPVLSYWRPASGWERGNWRRPRRPVLGRWSAYGSRGSASSPRATS